METEITCPHCKKRDILNGVLIESESVAGKLEIWCVDSPLQTKPK